MHLAQWSRFLYRDGSQSRRYKSVLIKCVEAEIKTIGILLCRDIFEEHLWTQCLERKNKDNDHFNMSCSLTVISVVKLWEQNYV